MRVLTALQENVLGIQHRSVHLRVEIERAGAWVDMTDLEGWDWVINAAWSEDVDSPTMTADVVLKDRIESLSLMTFDDDSKINASSTLVDMGKRIRIWTATIGMDQEPESADWGNVFDGYIDEFDETKSPIKLRCRDKGAEPMDLFIERQLAYPATGADDKVENIMQDILDDNTPELAVVAANFTFDGTTTVAATGGDTSELTVGDWFAFELASGSTVGPFFKISAITPNVDCTILNPAASARAIPTGAGAGDSRLIPAANKLLLYSENGAAATPFDVADTPAWNILKYNQRKIHVLEALRILAMQIGWDVRYHWQSTTGSFELMFFQPDRAKTTPDHTFDQSLYRKITKLAAQRYNVRNVVTVSYDDSTSGVRASVTVTDAPSIAKYGRRAMELAMGSGDQIDTNVEASLLANAALSDLKEPDMDHDVLMPYFWPAQIGDLYRWLANDVHYTSNQDLAVVSIRHKVAAKEATTVLMTRGKPSGGFKRWLEMESRLGVASPSDVKSDAAPSNVAAVTGIEGITITYDDPLGYTPPVKDWAYTECYVDTGAVADPPAGAHLKASGRVLRFDIIGLTPGTVYNARLVMYDHAGNKSATSAQVNATAGKVSSEVYVADGILGPIKAIGDNVRLNLNPDVNVWSKGSGFVPDRWRII